ncbi:MAG: DUF503 domain-containing protein [Ardenticatenaceae bacterium]|nr:DUF503 domain-containing protein [Ardenticatenaceae bacterium]HBY96200.1 DUF503 domain-containing protein [Chloroflexota bacterium]
MIVATCRIELDLPSRTLKEKRQILQSVVARMRRSFNVAVAEVDLNELWGSAALGIVTVSNSADYAQGLLERVVAWLEGSRLDLTVVGYEIEIL